MAFDAYHRWLGIAPQDQPPNHYRLLGIDLFERDPAVIEAAADRQMGHLRNYQSGKNSALSQKLLNEVATAKVCLLNPQKKVEYDRRLREQLKARQKPVPRAKPREPGEPDQPVDSGLTRLFEKAGGGADVARSQLARTRRQTQVTAGVAIGVVGLIAVVGLVLWASASTSPTMLTLDWPESQRRAGKLQIDGERFDLRFSGELEYPLSPGDHRVIAKRPGYEPFEERFTLTEGKKLTLQTKWRKLPPVVAGLPTEPRPGPQVSDTDGDLRSDQRRGQETRVKQGETLAELKPPKVDPPKVVNNTPKPADPQPEPVKKPEKLPVPPADEREKVAAQLHELFDLSKDRKAAELRALAKEMLDLAGKSAKPAERYVLLQTAAKLSCQAGDGLGMFGVIDKLAAAFEVDALSEKRAMVGTLAKSAKDSAAVAALLATSDKVIDEALSQDKYDLAVELAEEAYKACAQIAGREHRKRAFDHRKEVQALAASWKELQAVFDKLKSTPDDPEANLAAGRHYCFDRGDWDKGLAHLAKSSDADLKKLAQQELDSPPADPDAMLKLADAWWSLSESRQGREQQSLQLRAGTWYRETQPEITSTLVKAKLTKRLEEIAKLGRAIPQLRDIEVSPGKRFPRGRWVGLLPSVALGLDTVEGEWTYSRSELTMRPSIASRVLLPVIVDGEYDLSVEFTRTESTNSVVVGFPVGARSSSLMLSGWGGAVHGLFMIDGKDVRDNPTTRRPGTLLSQRRYTVLLTVRQSGDTTRIDASLDGAPLVEWEGHTSSLDCWATPDKRRILLGGDRSTVTFHRVRMRLVRGTASLMESRPRLKAG